MRAAYVATAAAMASRELVRKRLVLALGLCLPVVFFAAAVAMESNQLLRVVLASGSGKARPVEELDLSLLFLAIAATGIISAFFAANLIQRQLQANRRLVLCGYSPVELIAARVSVLLAIALVSAIYIGLVLALLARMDLFTPPRFPAGVLLGLVLAAFVHACYGLLVGTLFANELASIFAILVLVNIDAGWLQNPIYYGNAGSKWLIEALPAHYPSQVIYVSAFTFEQVGRSLLNGLAYGCVLLLFALWLYVRRMRVAR
jgi:hypothetical protein